MAVDRNLRHTLSLGAGFAVRVAGATGVTALRWLRTGRGERRATRWDADGSIFSDSPSNGLLFTAKA
ncbi:hypothetical protein C3E77_10695 [Mycetocola zhujimingii]|uniref:Uncharacterized protein n=1 Tax=Mycetocola zhujimingii TaxID=2079792 RepID=A0A2U1TDG5_9MICO|nr:hypothetical protein C3E77_10695 [Mycetocola zhujimingii]PWC06916.1 hypothetical protein DF223_08005 [Mycetocola zhujimingii]